MKRAFVLLPILMVTHALAFIAMRPFGDIAKGQPNDQEKVDAQRPAKSIIRHDAADSRMRVLRDLQKAGLSREDFEAARKELFREWIKADLGKAMELLYGPMMRMHFQGLAEELAPELREEISRHPRDVWQWIRSGRFGSNRREPLLLWLDIVSRGGQRDVLFEALPETDGEERGRIISELFAGADAAELASLRKALPSPDEITTRVSGSYAARALELAGDDISQALATEDIDAFRVALVDRWSERELALLPPGEKIARIVAVPEDLRAVALGNVLRSSGEAGIGELQTTFDEIDRYGLWQDFDDNRIEGVVDAIVAGFGQGSILPQEYYSTLSKISREDIRHAALWQAGKDLGWLRSGVGTQEVIQAAEPGPDRDAFISGLVRGLLSDKDADVSAQLEQLSNPAKRREVEEQIVAPRKARGE